MKTIMKDLIIVLLLVLAILLVLGVFLYDYIPMNKVVPKIEPYEAPNNVKEELEDAIEDNESTMTPIIREINSNDLKIYEKSKDYQKGKVNPFADTLTNTINGNNVSNGTSTSTGSNTSSEGGYLPNTGTK